jgi:flavodoxin
MKIAQAMVHSFSSTDTINCLSVKEVKPEDLNNTDLLIVGSPTRQFRATPDIMTFLTGIPDTGLTRVKIAGFDTRLTLKVIKSRIFRFIVDKGGYAAKIITEKLVSKGGKLIAPPEGFFVSGEEGPLEAGEIERAADWAKKLLKQTETI